MTRTYHFRDGRTLALGKRTLVMGIVNVTPDSFSDGGRCVTPQSALRQARSLVEDGADLIDVGAESTRPAAAPIDAGEEISRLRPALELLLENLAVPVSVDTYKAATARFAARLGAHLINDVGGLQRDPGMAAAVAECSLPVIVMAGGHAGTARDNSLDVIDGIRRFFSRSIAIADAAGIPRGNLILDPGIGFGKSVEDNLAVLRRLAELKVVDGHEYPLLLGTSRKSFIGATLGLPVGERAEATGATCVLGVAAGAAIVRVHDVKPIRRMVDMADAIVRDQSCENHCATGALAL